jgi:hypothetical protein
MGTGAVSRMSRLQSIVALSMTEAEFISAVSASQEIVWMCSFLGELGYSLEAPSLLLVNNQLAIQVARNPEHHGRMKYLDLRFFWEDSRCQQSSGEAYAGEQQRGCSGKYQKRDGVDRKTTGGVSEQRSKEVCISTDVDLLQPNCVSYP